MSFLTFVWKQLIIHITQVIIVLDTEISSLLENGCTLLVTSHKCHNITQLYLFKAACTCWLICAHASACSYIAYNTWSYECFGKVNQHPHPCAITTTLNWGPSHHEINVVNLHLSHSTSWIRLPLKSGQTAFYIQTHKLRNNNRIKKHASAHITIPPMYMAHITIEKPNVTKKSDVYRYTRCTLWHALLAHCPYPQGGFWSPLLIMQEYSNPTSQ